MAKEHTFKCDVGNKNDSLTIREAKLLNKMLVLRISEEVANNKVISAEIRLSFDDEFALCQLLNKRAKERAERPLEPCENIGS